MQDKKVYLRSVLSQVPRLLSQLDRDNYSKTYGCLDWNYWHDKTSGFPNGHAQEGMLVLSLLYNIDDKENVYYRSEKVAEWASAALSYWADIQHKDGTVDEFYVNERQLGATAITLYAAARTFLILKKHIKAKEGIVNAIRRSAELLKVHDETYVLSNHQAQVVLALYYSGKVLNIDYSAAISKKLKRITDNQSKDGWFLEYSGADLGYLSTTISFLSEYYLVSGDASLKGPLKKAMKFASYFLYPDGSYGGIIGSRNTSHLWLSGFEAMHKLYPGEYAFCRPFCDAALDSIEAGLLLTPEKEDRYFSEQMYDYLNAFNTYKSGLPNSSEMLPWQGTDFRIFFNDSKIYLSKTKDVYLVINAKKGGVIRAYSIQKRCVLFSDAGFYARLSDGKTALSGHIDDDSLVEVTNEKLSISGRFKLSSQQKQSVLKISALNIFMLLFGRTIRISNLIKDRLISSLISGKKYVRMKYTREIEFATFVVMDRIELTDNKTKVSSLSAPSSLKDIFVAYSKSFDFSELIPSVSYIFSDDEIKKLNSEREIILKRGIF